MLTGRTVQGSHFITKEWHASSGVNGTGEATGIQRFPEKIGAGFLWSVQARFLMFLMSRTVVNEAVGAKLHFPD